MPSATRFCRHRSQARPIASWSPGCASWNVVRKQARHDSTRKGRPGPRHAPRYAALLARDTWPIEVCENPPSMYLTTLLVHSWLRWLALVAGGGATFLALGTG